LPVSVSRLGLAGVIFNAASATPVPFGDPPILMSESNLLGLNCWLLDDDPNNIFTIEISRQKNVSALKKAITVENPQSFLHVDARCLALWKVSNQTLVTGRMLTRHLPGFHPCRQKIRGECETDQAR
jgi:hypothetical protein